MQITVKINTLAAQCDENANLSSNIRPHHFNMERTCEVIKSGWSRNFSYQWFVIRPFAGCVFVTTRDVSEIIITQKPVVVQDQSMVARLARAVENCK